jgi:hypothetical protein
MITKVRTRGFRYFKGLASEYAETIRNLGFACQMVLSEVV